MSGVPRPPAPNLSPEQMLRVIEFEHAGTDTFGEANRWPFGIEVITSEAVKPGWILGMDGPAIFDMSNVRLTGPAPITALVMHPLDRIAFEHKDSPLDRLDAAMAWIVADAHRKLDRLAHRLGTDTFEEADHA